MTLTPPAPANHRGYGTILDNATWGSGTRISTVALTTAAVTELKSGSTTLSNRHTLFIENDTSGLFYIKNTTSLNTVDGFLVDSGTSATIRLDPTKSQKVYAIAFTGTVRPHVVEIKS